VAVIASADMATLSRRRVAILVFLLLGLCVSAPARQTPAPPAGPRIDLTVGLSREGQLYPVAYAEFYLVAADPKELLKAAGLRLNRDLSDGEDEGEALIAEFVRVAGIARTGIYIGDSEYLHEFNKKATWALMPHLVDTATTNEDGRLTLGAAKPGSYYLMGGAQPPASAVWDVPIKLDRDQAVRLDGSNTMAASRAHDAN
jgi:hypothetical protein